MRVPEVISDEGDVPHCPKMKQSVTNETSAFLIPLLRSLFSPVPVYLSVCLFALCLFVNVVIFMKFYGMIGPYQGSNRLDFQ